MEARELRYFLALAEELHFGRAAASLSLAPSALSRAVSGLEEDLGTELFTRDAHGVTLTASGELLLDGAREVLARLDQAIAGALEAGHRTLNGSLTIAVAPALRHRVGEIIERYASLYPEVELTRREESGGPLVQRLLERRADIGLAFCPPVLADLDYEPIGDASLVVLVAADHPLAARSSVNLFELAGERFLAPSATAEPGLRERLEKVFAKAGFRPRYSQEAIDHDEDLTALVAGRGVMLSSRFFRDTLPAEVRLLELTPAPRLPFELVHRRESRSPALARFVQVARAVTRRG